MTTHIQIDSIRTKNNDPLSTPIARGNRLKVVRRMAGFTRSQIENDYGISASTIQSWESAKAGGLTIRGVLRMLPILEKRGVECTPDWLLYGIGNSPRFCPVGMVKESLDLSVSNVSEEKLIVQELLIFRSLNPQAVDLMLRDDGMGPYYMQGDYVAGKSRDSKFIPTLLGQDCIIRLSNNEILFRRIKKGSREGLYMLVAVNPDTTLPNPVLYDQKVLSAAPVVWHRRKEVLEPD